MPNLQATNKLKFVTKKQFFICNLLYVYVGKLVIGQIMSRITFLRTLVNNGWTIVNRRAVCSKIGKSNFEEIVALAKKKGITGDVFEYQMVKDELLPTKLTDIKSTLLEQSADVRKWGKELRTGDTYCWNSELYGKFKELDSGMENRAIHRGIDDKVKTLAKDKLFDKCKPLGRDEIHYRGEMYFPRGKTLDDYNMLANLKPGDIYEPKTFLWITDNEAYALETYCNPLSFNKNVFYEIFCPAEAKVIQANYSFCSNGMFTEGVYPRTTRLKILNKELKDGILRLRCELLPQ